MNDLILEICRDEDGLALRFKKWADDESSGDQDAENQPSGDLCFNPLKNEWVDGDEYFALEIMRPYLCQFVRFKEAALICEEHSFTQEDMTTLDSISHVWSSQSLWLCAHWKEMDDLDPEMKLRNTTSNSLHNILSNDAIFSSRCLDLYDATQFVPLHNYSRVYTVDVLLLDSCDIDDHLNIGTLMALIEHKSQFPQSKTVLVVDISTFETRVAEVTDAIRKSFSSASRPCSFELVIADAEGNGESEEFRLENGTTREVLQLKNVKKDSSFVTKICEICNQVEYHEKFIHIERYRI